MLDDMELLGKQILIGREVLWGKTKVKLWGEEEAKRIKKLEGKRIPIHDDIRQAIREWIIEVVKEREEYWKMIERDMEYE